MSTSKCGGKGACTHRGGHPGSAFPSSDALRAFPGEAVGAALWHERLWSHRSRRATRQSPVSETRPVPSCTPVRPALKGTFKLRLTPNKQTSLHRTSFLHPLALRKHSGRFFPVLRGVAQASCSTIAKPTPEKLWRLVEPGVLARSGRCPVRSPPHPACPGRSVTPEPETPCCRAVMIGRMARVR